VHSFTLHFDGGDDALVEAQVVQAHKGMSLRTVFDEIYDLNLDGRLRTEMLIVRLPVDEQWTLSDLEAVDGERTKVLFEEREADVFSRIRDRAVHILMSHGGRHVLTGNLNPHWADDPLATYGIAAADALTAIRKAEFEHILERSRAILTGPSGSRFRAPSGRLLKSFVRVGNIQYDRDAVDAIFFWMLPYLEGVGAILTDTWSISSIGFNLARLASVYFSGPPRVVEMLPSYNDGSDAAKLRARAVIERLDADYVATGSDLSTVLCVISATQTGSLERHLTNIFSTSEHVLEPRFVAIFALGDTDLPSLHDLHNDPRFTVLEEEKEHPSTPVAIDPQVYFPLQFEDTIIDINKAIADRSRAFFDRYVGAGLIEVHRTHEEISRSRHHAIHLATERLLNVAEFVALYEAELAKLPSPPRLIISPPHQAGRALASHAQDYFKRHGTDVVRYEHPNLYFPQDHLTAEDTALRAFLADATPDDALLIVDDVCITGTRLSQYQRYIRTEGYRGRIDYLVGVSRPAHPDAWNNLQRCLRFRPNGLQRHTVSCVDTVLLPDWRDDECPWCREKRLYESWNAKAALPEALLERLEALSLGAATGLTEDLYLRFPGLEPLALGPESLFANEGAAQAEVFTAIAAALQHLRSSPPADRLPLGPRRFPVSTVLDHSDYLTKKWTDSILRATMLRAATADELVYASNATEAERTKALTDLVIAQSQGEHEIALEVLLAANLRKCQLEVNEDMIAAVGKFGSADVSSYLFTRLASEQ
jgi:hypothetical protein